MYCLNYGERLQPDNPGFLLPGGGGGGREEELPSSSLPRPSENFAPPPKKTFGPKTIEKLE